MCTVTENNFRKVHKCKKNVFRHCKDSCAMHAYVLHCLYKTIFESAPRNKRGDLKVFQSSLLSFFCAPDGYRCRRERFCLAAPHQGGR